MQVACTLCGDVASISANTTTTTATITRPDFVLDLPGVGPASCEIISNLAPSLFALESSECHQLRALAAPLCGCPIPVQDPCLICSAWNSNNTPTTISDIAVPQQQIGDPSMLAELLFDNQISDPSCEYIQAVLLTQSVGTDQCTSILPLAQQLCPCPLQPPPEQPNDPDPTTTNPDQQNQEDNQRCTLCAAPEHAILYPDREIPNFIVPTCGVLDSSVSFLSANSTDCYNAQQFGIYCGCPRPPNACSLCSNGRDVPKPHVFLNFSINGYVPTCAIYQDLVANLDASDDLCTLSRGAGVEPCGCPALVASQDTCQICPGGFPTDYLDQTPQNRNDITCGFVESLQYTAQADSWDCFLYKSTAHLCGCRGGVANYGGTETRWQQRMLAWAPRFMAFLSILGSAAILRQVATNPTTMYHQLMIGISFSDILSSLAWMLSTLPIPTELTQESGLNIYGAMGNMATCKFQGLLLQLGGTSIWFNAALTIYYKFVIVDGWRESWFTWRIRIGMLGVPMIIGTTFAFAGLPYYDWSALNCTIRILPFETYRHEFLWFILIPGTTVIVFVTGMVCFIFLRFKAVRGRSRSWRVSSTTSGPTHRASSTSTSTLSQQQNMAPEQTRRCMPVLSCLQSSVFSSDIEGRVLRQSLFYVVAFLGSFPITLVTALLSIKLIFNYKLILATVILAPIQGFSNALIFFRPRLMAWVDARKSIRKKNQKAAQAAARHTAQSPSSLPVVNENDSGIHDAPRALMSHQEMERKRYLLSHFVDSTASSVPAILHENDDVQETSQLEHTGEIIEMLPSQENSIGPNEEDDRDNEENDRVIVGSFVLPRGQLLLHDEELLEQMDYSHEVASVLRRGSLFSPMNLGQNRGSRASLYAARDFGLRRNMRQSSSLPNITRNEAPDPPGLQRTSIREEADDALRHHIIQEESSDRLDQDPVVEEDGDSLETPHISDEDIGIVPEGAAE